MAEIQQIRNEYEEQNIAEPERATSTPVPNIDIELPSGWDELNIDDYDRSREEIDLRTAAESLQRSINRASETLNQSTNTTFKTPAKTSTKRPITSPFEDNQEKKNRIEDHRKTTQRSISRDSTVGSQDSRKPCACCPAMLNFNKSGIQVTQIRNGVAYTTKEKLNVIAFAEAHGNRAAGREFNINESNIMSWRSERGSLLEMPKTKCAIRGRKALFPEVEAEVLTLIEDKASLWLPLKIVFKP
ncbi:hypothetical protein LOTGIDRAFT_176286 [Lottia gigantea]|uniref:HTH psq-type domain-containing protein n=1 Tax=Lottia gigantea TaxID=225164 RepID=V3ZEF4_LOTGI|nr:hypothetical protein LOTGIDRAFT_176286 [Lottia gigantea]ESO82447.1 hypothetical protein LOTGIDRAFT_176286 [Lottia gigantea]